MNKDKREWRITIDHSITDYCPRDFDKLRKKVQEMAGNYVDQMFEDDTQAEFNIQIQAVKRVGK